MKTIRYNAAGGIVAQRDIIDHLPAAETFLLLLDRPSRAEVRLPKGHIDPGESAEEAALRETSEETGFGDLRVLADLGRRTVEFDYKGAHYIRKERYFLMELLSPRQITRPPKDAKQFQVLWEPLGRAGERLTFEAERLFIADAVNALRELPGF
ncbi:MAG: NUDIX domain-containing protein [Caldilineaceae bacterium SB0675_bin_29]|uniref:NUDIX domain-containing protein n=1 Tax=Caldilineaceae bacterium SB0675_bin_29 TaxID=2605266 RepID=A0A6B1GAR0_9CHLR|nr:NUDIX domain-containing protein [Caldilineaceae bacterium SB0675_bin_29]